MIRVECLSKTFKKEIKKNGLKGSISSFLIQRLKKCMLLIILVFT